MKNKNFKKLLILQKQKILFILLTSLLYSLLFFSCSKTVPKNKKLTFHEYSVNAKNAYDRKQYTESIRYQSEIIKNFQGKSEYKKQVAWAQYEIGFCYLVMKDYVQARENFNKVIENYDVLACSILTRQRLDEIDRLEKE